MVVIPADRSQTDPWWEPVIARGGSVTLIEMPPDTSYADRNTEIVHQSDAIVGFPAYPENDQRSLRSGTWQTVRMAERAGVVSQWHCVNPPYAGRVEKYIENRHQAG